MAAIRRSALFFSTVGAFVVAALIPASVYAAVEQAPSSLPVLSYDLASYAPAPAHSDEAAPAETQVADVDQASLTCMAKVVHHESRGQPRKGMLAVAQTLLNRVKAGGRFGDSVCGVASQPGQYFKIAAYHPNTESADWQAAVDVSRDALRGTAEDAAQGALFFHAGYAKPNTFFRSRQKVAAIGGQVFYR